MAKVAKFDRQNVIDKVTALYWEKGYHATSMRNLQDETDLRPGSIYSTFGGKDVLFKEALMRYTDNELARLEQLNSESDSPLFALKAFVKAQVIDTLTNAPSGMCMLSKTIGELTEQNQDLIDVTRSCLMEVGNALSELVKRGQEIGEITDNKTANELATHVQIQIAGLRTFAKINPDEALLNSKIDEIFCYYPFS